MTLTPEPGVDPDYALIEHLFFAYREFVADADRLLAADGFGRAHHRVLHFVARRPGQTVAELLVVLRITKQSLARVLRDLVERGYVESRPGDPDRRQRRLFATRRGGALALEAATIQASRLTRAAEHAGIDRATALRFLDAVAEPDAASAGAAPPAP